MTDERVSFRAHFDRYPVSVKGAFVLRAADGVPHQVAFREARCLELAGGGAVHAGLRDVIQDVAPNKDLFVPFEVPSADLPPGWYQFECDVTIDGTPSVVRAGERFCVAWPRAATRRGAIAVGVAVAAGGGKVRVAQVDCAADSARLTYEASEPHSVRLGVDGHPLAVLDHEHDAETGQGRLIAYPLLRSHEVLTIDVRGADSVIEVPLA
jgi:hypothetical protein